MNDANDRDLIQKTVEEALGGAAREPWSEAWTVLQGLGFAFVGVAEELGGPGGALADLGAVLAAAGYAGSSVPLVEATALAPWLLSRVGLAHLAQHSIEHSRLPTVTVPRTVRSPLRLSRSGDGWRLSGVWRSLAWAPVATDLVVLASGDDGTRLAMVPVDAVGVSVDAAENLAAEPRGHVHFDATVIASGFVSDPVSEATVDHLLERAALCRSVAMCGALRRVREMTVQYATDRVQFGRPLRAFQAIQQHLADVEGWLRGAQIACAAAVASSDPFAVASAVTWTSRAGREVSRCAHQVHGAIGVTHELDLHRFTRRLLAWSCEHGNEAFWAARTTRLAGSNQPGAAWRS
ncbi:MAG: acyl-CoA dehydrogenase family protein [Actinomycetota bacterium]